LKKSAAWNIFLFVMILSSLYFYIWTPWPLSILLLQIIPAVLGQLLICRLTHHPVLRLLLPLFTCGLSLRGTWLFFTCPPSWRGISLAGLLFDYCSPAVCSLLVLALYRRWETNQQS